MGTLTAIDGDWFSLISHIFGEDGFYRELYINAEVKSELKNKLPPQERFKLKRLEDYIKRLNETIKSPEPDLYDFEIYTYYSTLYQCQKNGPEITVNIKSGYIDEAIKRIALPFLKAGYSIYYKNKVGENNATTS